MKTHYEERLEADLTEIRRRVVKVSSLIEDQVRDAVHALLEDDRDLANEVILGDRRVNRKVKDLDHLCHAFIVRHAPSAGHLRFVSAVLRLDVALERIGDYASNMSREAVQLCEPPPGTIARDIELISHQSRRALRQALTAFHEADEELARAAHGLADQTNPTLHKLFAELLAVGEKRELPLRDVFNLLRIIHLLNRTAEQAENICEQTIFAVTGDTGDPKVFRILFVDERNDCASQIAEAYARRAFPRSGVYSSAGWNPAEELDAEAVAYAESNSFDLRDAKPKKLKPIHEEPRHYHVVVGIGADVREHIPEVPFRTVFLEWDLDAQDGCPEEGRVDGVFKTLAGRIQDLIDTLRGPDGG